MAGEPGVQALPATAILVFFLTAAVPSLALTFARMPSADTTLAVTGFICAFVAYFSVRRKAARWNAAYCAKLIELRDRA